MRENQRAGLWLRNTCGLRWCRCATRQLHAMQLRAGQLRASVLLQPMWHAARDILLAEPVCNRNWSK